MKLKNYKANVIEYLCEIFPDKENLKQQVKDIYRRGNFNDFETYAAACIMRIVNRYTDFALYDMVMGCVSGVTDMQWITLYKAAFKEYTGSTLLECTK